MYRDDLAAVHARVEQLERELADASSQGVQDQQRIAMLWAQLGASREALARMGQVQQAMPGYALPGYPPSGYAPPGYAPAQYIYPSRATTVLVLGILSLTVCGLMGPIAWSMGTEELRRIDNGQTPGLSRGSAVAGRVCGIIGTVLLILTGVMMVTFLMTTLSVVNR